MHLILSTETDRNATRTIVARFLGVAP
jgi:hypothetical protein